MKKWMLIPALAGVVAIGGVAMANDSTSTANQSENKLLTLQEAKELAVQKSGGVVTDIELEMDGKRYYYDVELEDEKFEYDIEVDARTGEILKYKKELDDDKVEAQTGEVLTKDEAIAIAKTKAAGTVKKFEIDSDDGRKVYEIELRDNEFEYDVKIDAVTGEFLEFEKELYRKEEQRSKNDHTLSVAETTKPVAESSKKQTAVKEVSGKEAANKQSAKKQMLTKDQALAIAYKYASGVVTDFELDDHVYEIELEDGDIEFDIEIHAYTGAVLSFERDDD